MTNSQRLNHVRELLNDWFRRIPETHGEPMEESILIRGGFFCGRRFRIAEFSAIWFEEENQIKFYDAQGHLADALMLDQVRDRAPRRAA